MSDKNLTPLQRVDFDRKLRSLNTRAAIKANDPVREQLASDVRRYRELKSSGDLGKASKVIPGERLKAAADAYHEFQPHSQHSAADHFKAHIPHDQHSAAQRAHEIAKSQGGHFSGSGFDENQHPRHPAGQHEGGQFAPKAGATNNEHLLKVGHVIDQLMKEHGPDWVKHLEREQRMGRLTARYEAAAKEMHSKPRHHEGD